MEAKSQELKEKCEADLKHYDDMYKDAITKKTEETAALKKEEADAEERHKKEAVRIKTAIIAINCVHPVIPTAPLPQDPPQQAQKQGVPGDDELF